MFGHRETVTLLRDSPGGFNQYGDPITSTTARIDVLDCLVAPNGSTESTARGRAGVSTGWTVFAPDGTDARFTDRLELFGGGTVIATGLPVVPAKALVCRIDGEVADWPGAPGGVVINVKRAVG